jgi:N-methylhydantoinase A
MQSWPVIIPPSPGVLCAYGDATTRLRVENARSFNKRFEDTNDAELFQNLSEMGVEAAAELGAEGVAKADQTLIFELDIRYQGQAFEVPLAADITSFKAGKGLQEMAKLFDAEHERLFTFNLDASHEMVNLRAVALGKAPSVSAPRIAKGDGNPGRAKVRDHMVFMDGKARDAIIYDRSKIKAGDVIKGPAVITEMDATTLVLVGHAGRVDDFGNILITPSN